MAFDVTDTSVKGVWRVSAPLMISFLSIFSLVFIDRLFLAHYSQVALNAATSAGTLQWAFIFAWLTVAAFAEVFVAQYNGANKTNALGKPVWQMIYFALISVLFFVPLMFWGSDWALSSGFFNGAEHSYFKWCVLFGPFYVINAAIGSFYIGQGKTNVIKWMGLLSNGVNIVLDWVLIFGIEGVIPSYGIAGAAIATGLGTMVQSIIFLVIFLKKKNREKYGTGKARFEFGLFRKIFTVGLPPAVFAGLEVFAWALFYKMMTFSSELHILVASVCQSVALLFFFFGFGLEKGVAAIAGNLIGAGRMQEVKKILKSGVKLSAIFFLPLALCLIVFPNALISLFFDLEADSAISLTTVAAHIRTGFIWVAFYIAFENIRWCLSGLLTSAGDTFFLMISGTSAIWLTLLVPTYFMFVKHQLPVSLAFVLWVVYSVLAAGLNLMRFKQGKWQDKSLLDGEETVPVVLSE